MLCHIATSLSQFPISVPYALIQLTDTLQQLNKSVSRSLEPRPIRDGIMLVLVPGHGSCHQTSAADWHFDLNLLLSHWQTLAWGSGLSAVCGSCIFFNHIVGCWLEWPLLCWPYFHVPEGTVDLCCSWTGGRVCGRWTSHSHPPDRMYSACIVLGFHLISGCFLDTSLPSSITNLSSKLLQPAF